MSPPDRPTRLDWYLSALAAIVILLLLTCGCASGWQAGEKAALGAEISDLGTTWAGIGSGRAQEANPLYGQGETALLTSLAVTAALHALVRAFLRNASEEEQRKVWRGVSVLRFTVAGWNLTQLERGRE